MGANEDWDVWQSVLAGDASSFGTIWDRHRDRVFRSLIAAGNVAEDAEDLTSMVFLELWRKRRSVRHVDGSLLPWLLVTAQNVHLNASRARRRYRQFLARIPRPESVPDHAEVIAERDSPTRRWVRTVLSGAREQDRHLIVLTALEGFTVDEAAQAIGITPSAAKMRLSRLRSRLRALPNDQSMPEGSKP